MSAHAERDAFEATFLALVACDAFLDYVLGLHVQLGILLFQILDEHLCEHEEALLLLAYLRVSRGLLRERGGV